jgi:hypothetical protein
VLVFGYSSSLGLVTVGLTGAVEGASPARLISPGTSRVLESSVSPKRSVRIRAGSGPAVNGCEQVASTIGSCVAACFPGWMVSGEAQIRALVKEAADAARNDYGVGGRLCLSAGGCPEGYGDSLESAGWDFEVMVREPLESLAANRMSETRIAVLRED